MSPVEADRTLALGWDPAGWLWRGLAGPQIRVAVLVVVAALSVAGFLSSRGAVTTRAPTAVANVATNTAASVSARAHKPKTRAASHHHKRRHPKRAHLATHLRRAPHRTLEASPTPGATLILPPSLSDDVVQSLPAAAPAGDLLEVRLRGAGWPERRQVKRSAENPASPVERVAQGAVVPRKA